MVGSGSGSSPGPIFFKVGSGSGPGPGPGPGSGPPSGPVQNINIILKNLPKVPGWLKGSYSENIIPKSKILLRFFYIKIIFFTLFCCMRKNLQIYNQPQIE